MNAMNGFRLVLLVGACATLGACTSSSSGGAAGGAGGSGGGSGGGGTPAQAMAAFDAEMDKNTGVLTTTINPTGKVNYTGKTKLNTINAKQTGFNGFVIGDLAMQADFDRDTVSGTATNFKGEVDGQAFELAGTLDTANVTDNSPNSVVTSAPTTIAGHTIRTTVLTSTLDGNLKNSLNDESSDVRLVLSGGVAYGPNAERIQGGATAIFGDKDKVGFGFGGAGEFYLDKK
ncbi:hypothetical protein OO012_17110 [Rhodobacteraceae bacterium KMM 6894]|nr:hypothetical protein [Rhodobacteraceae bacterium KMM 6894]